MVRQLMCLQPWQKCRVIRQLMCPMARQLMCLQPWYSISLTLIDTLGEKVMLSVERGGKGHALNGTRGKRSCSQWNEGEGRGRGGSHALRGAQICLPDFRRGPPFIPLVIQLLYVSCDAENGVLRAEYNRKLLQLASHCVRRPLPLFCLAETAL